MKVMKQLFVRTAFFFLMGLFVATIVVGVWNG